MIVGNKERNFYTYEKQIVSTVAALAMVGCAVSQLNAAEASISAGNNSNDLSTDRSGVELRHDNDSGIRMRSDSNSRMDVRSESGFSRGITHRRETRGGAQDLMEGSHANTQLFSFFVAMMMPRCARMCAMTIALQSAKVAAQI